jgi:hypothetical protein
MLKEGPPPRNRRRQPAMEGEKGEKTPESSRSVPTWGPPPRPDLRKYFRSVTLHQITDNYEPNGKSYTIGELRHYAPTMGITAHGAPYTP